LPFLVATHRLRDRYGRALGLLDKHAADLLFPVDHFRWHAAYSLISADSGKPALATMHAIEALKAAAREHSGFRYHPSVGLVTADYDEVVRQLEQSGAAR
jgi:hypothetical protein